MTKDKEKVDVEEVKVDSVEKTPRKKTSKKRIVLRISLIILAIIIGLAIIVTLTLDSIIAGAVRKIAPRVTGTEVKLTSVKTNLLSGRVELVGFTVGNPEGYLNPNAFELNNFVCQVQPKSILSDTIIVEEVYISGVAVDYEYQVKGSNLDVIQSNVKTFSGADKRTTTPPKKEVKPKTDTKEKPKKKVVIRDLKINDVSVSISSSLVNQSLTLPMPPISLSNIGEGKSMGEVVEEVYTSIMTGVAGVLASKPAEAINSAIKGLSGEAGKAIGKIGDAASKALDSISGKATDTVDDAKGRVNKEIEDAKKRAEQKREDAKAKANKKVDDAIDGASEKVDDAVNKGFDKLRNLFN